MRYLFLACLGLLACSDGPPTTPETRPVEYPNAGNTAIYDVDPDDPYEIDGNRFLDLRPGEPLSESQYLIDAGLVDTEEGQADRYHIRGDRNDTLGYLLQPPGDQQIGNIYITSPDVVTTNGLRVGVTLADLRERLGRLEFSRVPYGTAIVAARDGMGFVLEFYQPDLGAPLPEVPDSIPVQALIILQ
ncbi:hypothetical protein [Lewinella sp. IMCC34183]|uniref:hypothetical protein n=1 Tax=Lewinella sp. IMCC34183 TaxID=2248762 RepID=UPI000E243E87|nr:hypothetical protein [Lewinella sp. IMCC34183]